MSWDLTVERWRLFEDLGFDSIWDCRPLMSSPATRPARTMKAGPCWPGCRPPRKARIGVLVSCNTFRHPALVAKMAATIDHISGGRVDVGLGAGWYVPEHTMYGIDFPPPAELVSRFREAVEIVDSLLRNEVTTYQGRHYQLARLLRLSQSSARAHRSRSGPRPQDDADRRPVRGRLELVRDRREMRGATHPGRAVRGHRARPVESGAGSTAGRPRRRRSRGPTSGPAAGRRAWRRASAGCRPIPGCRPRRASTSSRRTGKRGSTTSSSTRRGPSSS